MMEDGRENLGQLVRLIMIDKLAIDVLQNKRFSHLMLVVKLRK